MLFVTSNEHKFMEIRKQLEPAKIEITWKQAEYEEIQADTTGEVSLDSAMKLSARMGEPFFIDDTGLYIDALNGFPGPYSSFVFRTIGNDGILRLVNGGERSARFITVITYFDGKDLHQFEGTVEGQIALEPRGSSGFGYDPIFIPEGSEKTLGEMPVEEKTLVSHRALAVSRFSDYLSSR